MEQTGNSEACSSVGRASSTRSMMPHRESDHWRHAALTQEPAKRKRFSAGRPCWAVSTNSWSTTMRSGANATRPSASTMPSKTPPECIGALRQRTVFFTVSHLAFMHVERLVAEALEVVEIFDLTEPTAKPLFGNMHAPVSFWVEIDQSQFAHDCILDCVG